MMLKKSGLMELFQDTKHAVTESTNAVLGGVCAGLLYGAKVHQLLAGETPAINVATAAVLTAYFVGNSIYKSKVREQYLDNLREKINPRNVTYRAVNYTETTLYGLGLAAHIAAPSMPDTPLRDFTQMLSASPMLAVFARSFITHSEYHKKEERKLRKEYEDSQKSKPDGLVP